MPVTTTHRDAATRVADVGGTSFAYRDLGPRTGTPVIFLNHLAAVLDNWDPRVVDGIAAHRRVITFDNRGVGASEGRTPSSIAEWPRTPSRSSRLSVNCPTLRSRSTPTPGTEASSSTTRGSSPKRWTSSLLDTRRPPGGTPS